MTGKPCVATVLICLLGLITDARSQVTEPLTPSETTVQKGRHFGFVPKHQRILQNRNTQMPADRAPRTSDERQSRASAPSPVQLASYEEVVGTTVIDGEAPGMFDDVIGASSCDCEVPCGGRCQNPFQLWGSIEYMHWWTDGSDVPSLATTGPAGAAQADAGVLPGATTLFGGDKLFDEDTSGGRYALGMWLNPARSVGIEITWISFDDDDSFAASSGDFTILARPFFNVDLGAEDSRLLTFDSLVNGNLSIDANSDFESFEVSLRRIASTSFGARSDFLIGYRRANLDESLRISESTTSIAGATDGTTFDLFDQFNVENEFHGGEIGYHYEGAAIGCWSMELLGKIAFGNTTSRVGIAGQTTTTAADGSSSTADGGLLTQNSNIGSFTDDEFSTLTELGISFNRQFKCGFGIKLGYTFLNWSDVARVTEQIDRSVNPTQIAPGTLTGAARPAVQQDRGDFSAHGLNLGIEYSF